MPRLYIAFAAVGAFVLAALSTQFRVNVVDAHYNWGSSYMNRKSDCTNSADPINLEFIVGGNHAVQRVEQYLGWTIDAGGTMYAVDHGICRPQGAQRESVHYACYGDDTCWRHIRLWEGQDATDTTKGSYQDAGAHEDREVYCPWPILVHNSSDFNGPRDEVSSAFQNRGYRVDAQLVGNDALTDQGNCLDDLAGDGVRKVIEMPADPPSNISSAFVYLGGYTYKNRLNWLAIPGVNHYHVCWDTSLSGSFASCQNVLGTQYDGNLPSGDGTKWYNKVQSCTSTNICEALSSDYTLSEQAYKNGWNYMFTHYRNGIYTGFQYINWMTYGSVPLGLKLHIKDGSSTSSTTRTTTSCLPSGYISTPALYSTSAYFTNHKLGTLGHTIGAYNTCGASSDHSGDATFNRWGYVPPYTQ